MQNKRSHLNWWLLVIIFIYNFNVASANESTPYAQYGLGLIGDNNYVPSSSMGGLGAAYRSTDGFNFNNPASLSNKSLTAFEAGLHGQFGRRRTNDGSTKIGNTGLDYLSISFPIIKGHWGMASGLLPFSSKNSYSMDTIEYSNGTQRGTIHNENSGHLYNFFWSNGFSYKEYSIGINMGYLFGNLSKNTLSYALKDGFPDFNGYGAWHNNTLTVKSFIFNLGAQYHKVFRYGEDHNKQLKLTLGVTGAPGFKLGKASNLDDAYLALDSKYIGAKSESETYKDYLTDLHALYPMFFDTLSINSNQKTKVHIPGYIQVGFTLADSVRWLVGFDYKYQPWSNYSGYGLSKQGDGQNNNKITTLQNSWRVGVGGEFLPSLSPDKGFFSKLKYRAGFHFEQTNIQIASQPINEFGINIGFGIPIAIRLYDEYNTRMYVYAFNLSFEGGSRGTLNNQLVKENYGKIKLGINLNSSWFQKRKYY